MLLSYFLGLSGLFDAAKAAMTSSETSFLIYAPFGDAVVAASYPIIGYSEPSGTMALYLTAMTASHQQREWLRVPSDF
jgi:hypothetical protein